jgi:hypothetical protein
LETEVRFVLLKRDAEQFFSAVEGCSLNRSNEYRLQAEDDPPGGAFVALKRRRRS